MTPEKKESILKQAKKNLDKIRSEIASNLSELSSNLTKMREDFLAERLNLKRDQQLIQGTLIDNFAKREIGLEQIYPSPYFVRCILQYSGEKTRREVYFSKYSFPELNIFSWTSPAATLRFEEIGDFEYSTFDDEKMHGKLLDKEQFLISDGKIVYMTAESTEFSRELIYQEFFSQHKSEFALKEIVEQMEKAQDKVIRAKPSGEFLISGPAGSGKTTLALHRAAYLIQSPDTATYYTEGDCIVFVQDYSTKDYFGTLLPGLGVSNVKIITFGHWAMETLKLLDYTFVNRFGATEFLRDLLEFEKNTALKNLAEVEDYFNPFQTLSAVYEKFLGYETSWEFEEQKRKGLLDRFDLTILLIVRHRKQGGLFKDEITYKQLKGGKAERIITPVPVRYNLMILDEVQNFLPEQVILLKKLVNPRRNSLIFVGDLAQQTRIAGLGTWDSVAMQFSDENKVKLFKNYRTTKQILQYISDLGFEVQIPDGIKEFDDVTEKLFDSIKEEVKFLKDELTKNKKLLTGILCARNEQVPVYTEALGKIGNTKVLSFSEAQGTEFDVVFLVGVDESYLRVDEKLPLELQKEKLRVNKDLLYVGLTRAMNNLVVSSPKGVSLRKLCEEVF